MIDYSQMSDEERAKVTAENLINSANNIKALSSDLKSAIDNTKVGFQSLVDNENNKHKDQTIQAITAANKILADLKKGKFDYKEAVTRLNKLKK